MNIHRIKDMHVADSETTPGKTKAAGIGGVAVSVRGRVYRLWQQLGIALVFILLCVIMSLTAPSFLDFNNLHNVARQAWINAILAAGMAFVILTGGIDLSVGSALAVAGVLSVWLAAQGVPDVVAVLAGIVTGGLCGALNGVLIAKFKLSPFIVTLGGLTYLRGLAYVTTGAYPLLKERLGFTFLGNSSVGPIPCPVIIALLVFAFGYILLNRPTFSRHVYALAAHKPT